MSSVALEDINSALERIDDAIGAIDRSRLPLDNYEALSILMSAIFDLGTTVNADGELDFGSRQRARLKDQGTKLRDILHLIYYYIGRFDQSLWGSWQGSWQRLCRKRSSLAFLEEIYRGTELTEGENSLTEDEFEDIDSNIRLLHKEEGGVADEDIPAGVPKSHWWWF